MKKIPQTATKCPFCSKVTHTPLAGMATLRVSCKHRLPILTVIFCPFILLFSKFLGYKVYISVDDQNYVIKSNKKQIDIPVSVGTHQVRIAHMSKKSAKATRFLGTAMTFVGAVTGSRSTVFAGSQVEDLGAAFSDNGVPVTFDPNELVVIAVKQAWNGNIVEDDNP